MKNSPKLIVMLTHDDQTVGNAWEIFDQCRNSKAEYWGMKEIPLPQSEMKQLCTAMKACGKTTFLEVVEYTEEGCMAGAKTAVECGFDILMGTVYSDAILDLCKTHGIKYMPFVGQVRERPSVLEGSVEKMVEQAHRYLQKGVYGIDLLGYRYTGDAVELNKRFVAQVDAPVCIAGSVDSYARLDQLKDAAPWAFTIGGAFFEHRFGTDFPGQIDAVCDYMQG